MRIKSNQKFKLKLRPLIILVLILVVLMFIIVMVSVKENLAGQASGVIVLNLDRYPYTLDLGQVYFLEGNNLELRSFRNNQYDLCINGDCRGYGISDELTIGRIKYSIVQVGSGVKIFPVGQPVPPHREPNLT